MDGMCPMGGAFFGTWGAGWGIGMMLLSLLFWVFIIVALGAAVWWLVRHGSKEFRHRGGSGLSESSDTAADILRQRFARGEINREEFEERQRVLGG
ncbi:MAG: SHOCT domain-containing protein [bacterium]